MTFQLQGHLTIQLSTPENLGIGEVSRPLMPLGIYKGHHEPSLTSNLTLTLTSQLQGHIIIGLSTPHNLGVGEVSRPLKPLEI